MHPLWKDKRGLALYLASWVVIGVLFSLAAAARRELGWGEAHAVVIPPTVLLGFMCLSTWYLCQAFPLDRNPVQRVLGIFLVSSAVTGALWVLMIYGWGELIELAGAAPGLAGRIRGEIMQWFATGNLLFLLAVAVHYLLIAVQKAGASERRALQLSLLARDAELKALRSQIDPHFLFNSLNSISALTSSDPPVARAMVLRLAGFLRSALDAGRREEVPLEAELALARDYLEIERMRFGARLTADIRAGSGTLRCAVPPLIVQPLVENAVKHGIAHRLAGGVVGIAVERTGDRLRISVTNPADPDRPHGHGLGLTNVRQRLEVLHKNEASVMVEENSGTFLVELEFPAREAGAQ